MKHEKYSRLQNLQANKVIKMGFICNTNYIRILKIITFFLPLLVTSFFNAKIMPLHFQCVNKKDQHLPFYLLFHFDSRLQHISTVFLAYSERLLTLHDYQAAIIKQQEILCHCFIPYDYSSVYLNKDDVNCSVAFQPVRTSLPSGG